MSDQRPNLPPRYVNLPVNVLYNASIPDAAFRTFAELVGFAWGKGNKAQVSFEPSEFLALTGKSERTLYGHLSILGKCGVLRYSAPKSGLWVVVLGSLADETSPVQTFAPLQDVAANNNIKDNIIDSSLILKDIEIIFQRVTSMFTIPSMAREDVENATRAIHAKIGTVEGVIDYLRPYFAEWVARGYGRQNCNWLTSWAVAGEIPKNRRGLGKDKPIVTGEGFFNG